MARRESDSGAMHVASSGAGDGLRPAISEGRGTAEGRTPRAEGRGPSEGRGIDDDVRYHLFKLVEDNPEITQREAAEALGVSLGKANYCFRALIRKGFVKARNFRNSKNKIGYAYLLTPRGIEEKVLVTRRFLDRKLAEYDSLVTELHALTIEVNAQRRANGEPEIHFEQVGKGGER